MKPDAENPFMHRLRHETRKAHDQTEHHSHIHRLVEPDLILDEYKAMLIQFYGYFKALDCLLLDFVWPENCWYDYSQRRRHPMMIQDLMHFGYTAESIAQLPICDLMPEVNHYPQALAMAYLHEGSTLGGQQIGHRLKESLGLTPESGSAYFCGRGKSAFPMWKEFSAWLEREMSSLIDQEMLIKTAQQGYHTLSEWMKLQRV